MKTGTRAYIKPERYLVVLFKLKNGKVRVIDGKGGGSWHMDSKDLITVPTLVNLDEQLYWEKEAENHKNTYYKPEDFEE